MEQFKKYENLLRQGKISRREFLTRVSAMGLAATLSPALLNFSAHAATPKKGGRLRIGCGGSTSETLDPSVVGDNEGNLLQFGILRNNLVELDHNSNLVPELAESWESTPDAAKWIFKLRKGIEFHNGKTLDAEDVIFSFNIHRGEGSKSAVKAVVEQIKEIKAEDKHTVIFSLDQGNADFPFVMSSFSLPITPYGTTNFDLGIGTGPYVLEKFEPGVGTLTKRNPNYWKKGRAHFDEVELIIINDTTARINALVTKQVDVIARPDMKTFHLLTKRPGIQGIKTTWTKHLSFPMNTQTAPYNNNDVRLALKYAVDRQQLVDSLLLGNGEVGNDHPIGRKQRYFASELPQRTYDPDKAKFHLKKAGAEGYTFRLQASDATFQGAVDASLFIKEHAAKAGIKIEVKKEPDDGFWSNVWLKSPWCTSFWYGRPTEDWMFSTTYAAGAAWNETHWKHERFNKLLKMGRAELDQAKRREIYGEMQQLVRDEGGAIIPAFMSDLHAATTKLKFENIAGNYEFDGFKIAERWWFDS